MNKGSPEKSDSETSSTKKQAVSNCPEHKKEKIQFYCVDDDANFC